LHQIKTFLFIKIERITNFPRKFCLR